MGSQQAKSPPEPKTEDASALRSRHARLRALFHAAAEADAETRRKLVQDVAAEDPALAKELAELLDADHDQAHVPDAPLPMVVLTSDALPDPAEAGPPLERVGHYRVIRRIGVGGVSVVYEAEQESPRRRVALKVIRPGLATGRVLSRFRAEAQILALLHHPNIAQVYEAGLAEDRQGVLSVPFIAMELIDGVPITEYAERQGLDLKGRLELFATLCDAVQYAHECGVIHRDLKPSNVLVDSRGLVKVLDFGIARATDCDTTTVTTHTTTGELVGTMAFMSPEQAGGHSELLDARSDVYSLGVVLFELLTGRLPYELDDMPIHEAVRVIREQPPPRLGKLNRRYQGDIEAIVGKALEKEPQRRYRSAAELAADVRHYLRQEPVRARRPSASYHLRKLVVRHKVPTGLAAAALLSLVGGTIGMAVLYSRAQHESQTAQRTAAFLEGTLRLMHTDQGGPLVPIRRVLDDAVKRIDTELAHDPEVEARVRRTIAMGYYSVEAYPQSLEQFRKALSAAVRVHGPRHVHVAKLHKLMADVFYTLDRNDEAQRHYREALGIYTQLLGAQCSDNSEILAQLGRIAIRRGDLAAAERFLLKSRAIILRYADEDSPAAARSEIALAYLRSQQRRFDEAESLLVHAIEVFRSHGDSDGNSLTRALNALANVRLEQGRPGEAVALRRDVLERYRRKFGDESRWVATQILSLAQALVNADRPAEAEAMLRPVFERERRYAAAGAPELLEAAALLSDLLRERGAHLEAERVARQGLADYRAAGVNDVNLHVKLRTALAAALAEQHKYEEAAAELLETYSALSADFGQPDRRVQTIVNELIRLYEAWSKPQQVATWRARLRNRSAPTVSVPVTPERNSWARSAP